MRWSKLKKNIENNFCNSLKGKVQIYTTTYGTGYDVTDMFNRGWITLDGKEVVNFSTPDSFKIFGSDYNSTTMSNLWAVEKTFNERNERRLIEKGEFSKFDLTHCCYEYLNMNITDALNHDSPNY